MATPSKPTPRGPPHPIAPTGGGPGRVRLPTSGASAPAPAPSQERDGLRLDLERWLDAPPAQVWRMWTTSNGMAKWAAPPPLKPAGAAVDLRTGGRFEATMRSPEGREYVAEGRYLEVAPPSRLVFTHAWRGDDEPQTVCTVELVPQRDGTLMRFAQAGFASEAERAGHLEGWEGCFALLAKHAKA